MVSLSLSWVLIMWLLSLLPSFLQAVVESMPAQEAPAEKVMQCTTAAAAAEGPGSGDVADAAAAKRAKVA